MICCDLLLKRAQHLRRGGVARNQLAHACLTVGGSTSSSQRSRSCVGLDVVADVVLGAFAEHLLVDARSVGSVVEVVADRRAAPANV